MIRNYIKTAFRSLIKNRVITFINLSGLALGMSSVVLIILFISDELSYDKFHEDADDIYRIAWQSGDPQTRTPHPMALAMLRDFPEVEMGTTLSPLWAPGLTKMTFAVSNPETGVKYDEKEILSVDSTFLDVFSFKLLKGNKKTALKIPNVLLVTESTAERYFGKIDPIGKFLTINTDDSEEVLEIAGVLEDVPANSHFHFDFLVSYVTLKPSETGHYYTWADFGHFNYIKLIPGADAKVLENKMMEWASGYLNWDSRSLERMANSNVKFILQPLTDIHLKSHLRWELESNGNISYVNIMSAAAIFILLIASVNFMNLTSAKSNERTKEIGVRKSLGAFRSQLAGQFIGESIMISLMAILIAGLLLEITLPWFNELTGKSLSLNYLQDFRLLGIMIGIAVMVGLISGIYPAMYLAASKPHLILKGEYRAGNKGGFVRNMLVVFQFAVSTVLISGSVVILKQLNYIQNKSLGFDKEQLLVLPVRTDEMRNQSETLKIEMLKISGVSSVSAVSNVPGRQFNQNPIYLATDDHSRVDASQLRSDFDIFNTLGLNIIEGRGFDRSFSTDSATAFVLNQKAVKALGGENLVGKELVCDADGDLLRGTIIGIVEDFHFQSLHRAIRPIIFQILPSTYNNLLLKVKTDDFENLISQVENVWKNFDNSFGFEFTFLDQTIDEQYRAEQRMGKVFSGFSFLAIIIAAMGLFALASLMFANKAKEVGIRKVLGAQPINLVLMLLKNFTFLVIVGIIIAIPIAWVIMSNWLQNFNFRIDLNPAIFILSAIGVIIIAWITLGYLTIRTATSNPIDSIRDE